MPWANRVIATGRCGRSAPTSAIRRAKPLDSMVMNTIADSSSTSVLAASVSWQQAGGQPDDLAVVDLPDEVGELPGHDAGVVEVGDDLVDEQLARWSA